MKVLKVILPIIIIIGIAGIDITLPYFRELLQGYTEPETEEVLPSVIYETELPQEETEEEDEVIRAENLIVVEIQDTLEVEESQTEATQPTVDEPVATPPESQNEVRETETAPEETIQIEAVDEVVYATSNVNVRTGPSTNYKKVGAFSTNDEVHRVGICDNNWSQIIYNGNVHYMSSKYLSTDKVVIPTPAPNPAPQPPADASGYEFDVEGSVSSELLNYMNSYYQKIPSNVKEAIRNKGWRVCLTTASLKDRYGYSGSIAGITDSKAKGIFVEARKNAIRRATIHEVGHFVDWITGWSSRTEEFLAIYDAERGSFNEQDKVDNHNTGNSTEFFAEIFNQMILYPEICSSSAPMAYTYVMNCMHSVG